MGTPFLCLTVCKDLNYFALGPEVSFAHQFSNLTVNHSTLFIFIYSLHYHTMYYLRGSMGL